jgi:hypothetical protein
MELVHDTNPGAGMQLRAPNSGGSPRIYAEKERYPGFPVQLSGSGALLAAFLNESRIRRRVLRSVQDIRV